MLKEKNVLQMVTARCIFNHSCKLRYGWLKPTLHTSSGQLRMKGFHRKEHKQVGGIRFVATSCQCFCTKEVTILNQFSPHLSDSNCCEGFLS